MKESVYIGEFSSYIYCRPLLIIVFESILALLFMQKDLRDRQSCGWLEWVYTEGPSVPSLAQAV